MQRSSSSSSSHLAGARAVRILVLGREGTGFAVEKKAALPASGDSTGDGLAKSRP